jgi:uncharacterized protein (TIGR00369 family)
MTKSPELLTRLRNASALAKFNGWLGFEITAVEPGSVELRLPWREEFGQYSRFLHAGIVAALIDTACGFAAATLAGPVLASQFSVRCLRPAVSHTFIARGSVLKPGKQQIFASAELWGQESGPDKLFAVGDALLVPTGEGAVPG